MSDSPDHPTPRHPSGLDPAGRLGRRRRTRWILIAAVVAVVGLLTALFSFGLSRDPTIVRSALIADPGSAIALHFGVYGVPETFFIDPTGRIAFKRLGPVTYEMLTDQITRLLPGGSR